MPLPKLTKPRFFFAIISHKFPNAEERVVFLVDYQYECFARLISREAIFARDLSILVDVMFCSWNFEILASNERY